MSQPDHSGYYSESGFWGKVGKFAKTVGAEGIKNALTLFYTLTGREVPLWVKGTIIPALGYFICPIDAIPDFIPVAGFTDDMAVMAAALGVIASHVPAEARSKAASKLTEWFG